MDNRPSTHCVGGWVGPRAGLDRCGVDKITCFHRDSTPEQSNLWRVAVTIPTEQSRNYAFVSASKKAFSDNFKVLFWHVNKLTEENRQQLIIKQKRKSGTC